jgi:hypothetical protein
MLSKNEDVKMSGTAKTYHAARPLHGGPTLGRVGNNE